jgi:hypothetical protein
VYCYRRAEPLSSHQAPVWSRHPKTPPLPGKVASAWSPIRGWRAGATGCGAATTASRGNFTWAQRCATALRPAAVRVRGFAGGGGVAGPSAPFWERHPVRTKTRSLGGQTSCEPIGVPGQTKYLYLLPIALACSAVISLPPHHPRAPPDLRFSSRLEWRRSRPAWPISSSRRRSALGGAGAVATQHGCPRVSPRNTC